MYTDSYAYFDMLESTLSPELPLEPNDDETVTPPELSFDLALLEDVQLLDSSRLMGEPNSNIEWVRYSSDILPKGMTDEHFKRFAFFLYEYFNDPACRFIGSRFTETTYVPPEAVYFKGSSVTCLKFNNAGIEGGLKTFGPTSDYDVGLVSQAAVDAMHGLAGYCNSLDSVDDVNLSNELAGFQSKVNPGSTNYLDIHNQDKNDDSKDDLAKRKFFPDGTPHIVFCDALNAFVGAEHPFNFVVVDCIKSLKYSTSLIMHRNSVVDDEAHDFLRQSEERVLNLSHSDCLMAELCRPDQGKDDLLKPVLVYSWRLIHRYRDLFCESNKTEAETAKTVFASLRAESQSQKKYCGKLLGNFGVFKPNNQTRCENTKVASVSNKFG